MTPDEQSAAIRETIELLRAHWGEESLPIDDQFNLVVRSTLLAEMWRFEVDLSNRMAAWIATVRGTVDPMMIAAADQLLAEWSELRDSDVG